MNVVMVLPFVNSVVNFYIRRSLNACVSQTWHDNTGGCSFSRWSFQKGYLRAWPIYCRLSRTGTAGLHRARLVPKVRVTATHKIRGTLTNKLFRCTAPAADLDSKRHVRRSQAHTELVVEAFELGVLWDEYGLVGDVVVSVLPSYFVSGS
jgi:hypothetical protein